jgi:hypothetical protein
VVVAVDHVPLAEMRREHRSRFDLDGVRRMRRAFAPPERRVDEGAPLVPLRAGVVRAPLGELLQVAVQRAAERHVQDLASAADREQRETRLDGRPRVVQLDLVEVGLARQVLRVRVLATVPPGLDVAAAREHEPVQTPSSSSRSSARS